MTSKLDHFCLIGFPNAGKSTFAKAMKPNYLVFDLDNRWGDQEVADKTTLIPGGSALEMQALVSQVKNRKFGTVIFDSVTPLLSGIIAQGQLEAYETGSSKGIAQNHKIKAATMRVLRQMVVPFHADTLWIFHLNESGLSGNTTIKMSITASELERLKLALTAVLVVVQDKSGRRGVRIDWTRYNDNVAKDAIIWDTPGQYWAGVPRMVGEFVRGYQGTENYTGTAYSLTWLKDYLASKGKEYKTTAELTKALQIDALPVWWDRNGWGELVKRGLGES